MAGTAAFVPSFLPAPLDRVRARCAPAHPPLADTTRPLALPPCLSPPRPSRALPLAHFNPFDALRNALPVPPQWFVPTPPAWLLPLPAVSVRNLTKRYSYRAKTASGKKEKITIEAVSDVSFDVKRGTIFGLLGPNSSGKTTTLKSIVTLMKIEQGSIEVFGADVTKNPNAAREFFGYVAQADGVDKILTGREHLSLFADLYHLPRDIKERNIEELIKLLRLEDYIDKRTGTYSGGIKRRLDLALAIIRQPPLLILDEPTAGLDAESRSIIWEILKDYRNNGGTVIFTSHYLEEVDILAEDVVIMEKGKVIAAGRTSDLKRSIGGDRISIRLEEFAPLEEAEEVLDALLMEPYVKSGLINASFGNSIELVVDQSSGSAVAITRLLEQRGYVDVFSFSQSKPSLGDVYLTYTGQTIMDADTIARQKRDPSREKKENMK